MRHVLVLLAVAAIAVGCGGPSKSQRKAWNGEYARLIIAPPAVLGDGCVLDARGIINIEASADVGRKAAHAIYSRLAERGVQAVGKHAPFACASHAPPAAREARARELADTEVAPVALPIVVDTEALGDPRRHAAMRPVMNAMHLALPPGRKVPETLPVMLPLAAADADHLRGVLGTADVWFVRSVRHGGREPQDEVALLNLARGELTWAQRIEPEGPAYGRRWATALLTPFLPDATPASVRRALLNPNTADDPAAPVQVGEGQALDTPDVVEAEEAPINTLALTPATGRITPLATESLPLESASPSSASPAPATPPARREHQLLAPAALRGRPIDSSPVIWRITEGTRIEILTRLQNNAGRWWFVRVGDEEGWMPAPAPQQPD